MWCVRPNVKRGEGEEEGEGGTAQRAAELQFVLCVAVPCRCAYLRPTARRRDLGGTCRATCLYSWEPTCMATRTTSPCASIHSSSTCSAWGLLMPQSVSPSSEYRQCDARQDTASHLPSILSDVCSLNLTSVMSKHRLYNNTLSFDYTYACIFVFKCFSEWAYCIAIFFFLVFSSIFTVCYENIHCSFIIWAVCYLCPFHVLSPLSHCSESGKCRNILLIHPITLTRFQDEYVYLLKYIIWSCVIISIHNNISRWKEITKDGLTLVTIQFTCADIFHLPRLLV